MLLKNARVYLPGGHFESADIRFDGEKIVEVGANLPGGGEDLSGLCVLPGLVDIHSHGCVGCDWSRGGEENYRKMARYYAQSGVTSVCATTMSIPVDELERVMGEIAAFMRKETGGANVLGINMEGPFFSKAKKGAQAEENLLDPSLAVFERLQKAAGGAILLCDLAPELPGAEDFISALKGRVVLSVAHTDAGIDTVKKAERLGASHATHLFNAMTPLTHRAPGVVGAVFDSSSMTAELISDGIHLHPATVRITFKALGPDRVALISDSMEAAGMPNGSYELGGQEVTVRDGLATLHDGTIAGSATNQFDCMRRAIGFGVPAETAIRAATENPARIAGRGDVAGSIAAGRNADLVVVDEEYRIRRVFVRGKEMDR